MPNRTWASLSKPSSVDFGIFIYLLIFNKAGSLLLHAGSFLAVVSQGYSLVEAM